jgi:hypothetical protein
MTKNMDALLALRIGRKTVAENLQFAVNSGALLRNEDGSYELPPAQLSISHWQKTKSELHFRCKFLNEFLYQCAYAQSAVPFGCKECYKVVVIPKTLRQLMALLQLQEEMECASKCGVDVDRPESQNLYVGYFYCIGLDRARDVYQIVREQLNNEPILGTDIPMSIKRGCTNFELRLGPSDKYEFRDELPELEAYLESIYKRPSRANSDSKRQKQMTIMNWIQVAYRVGDDTYLELTRGRRLYPKMVEYDPNRGKAR